MATAKKTAAGSWFIQIEIAGARESSTFPTKREADAWAQARAVELRATKQGRAGDVKTLRDALRRYAEEVSPKKEGWAKELIRLKAFEGTAHRPLPVSTRMNDITTADLVAWRDARLKVNTRGSVLRDMNLLSNVFEIARREWQWTSANVFTDVGRPAEPDHREVIITGPQMRRVLRALGWTRKPARTLMQAAANAFLLAMMTGMRMGEICALKPDDLHADFCRLRRSKTGKGRDVPLTPTALRVIGLVQGLDDASVFGVAAPTVESFFRRAKARAGLADANFHFHDSRHTAATRLAQRLHILDLCKVMGWKDPKRAMVYYNPKASDIARRITASVPAALPTPVLR